jgi:hypothetical protein
VVLTVAAVRGTGAEQVQLRQRHEKNDDGDEDDRPREGGLSASGEGASSGAPFDRLVGIEHFGEPSGILCRILEQLIEVVRVLVHPCHLRVVRRVSDSIWDASAVLAR